MATVPHGTGAGESGSWLAALRPARWLTEYEPRWLAGDAVAGITLAAFAIPVSLAYSGLAGLPPEAGLYGYLLGGVGYALWGSSRYLAIGPTSAISLMVGVTVQQMAGGDPLRSAQIAAGAALLVAALALLAWLLRLSTLTNFVSETVLLGFKAGAALSIASTQLAPLFGVPSGGSGFFGRIVNVGSQLGALNPMALGFGLGAIALLLIGERLLPGRPVAVFVVALAIAVVSLSSLHTRGLAVVGSIPSGLPTLGVPILSLADYRALMALAAACLLLAYVESVSAARTYAAKHDDPLDVRQELLGLGSANLLVAVGAGYPVGGGLSQTAINEEAGAKTPLALVFASATIALALLFLTDLVRRLPEAVLAAIVLVALIGLVDLRRMVHVWRVSRVELGVVMIALVGVLLLGILQGVVLAAIASILMVLRQASRPHVAFLGRIPGTRRYSDLGRHSDNERIPGVLVFRVESPLLYFNADHVLHTVLQRLEEETGIRLAVCDLSASPHIDFGGARMLAKLADELARRGIVLRLSEVHADSRDLLRAEGLEGKVGHIDRFTADADAIEHELNHDNHPAAVAINRKSR
jgi:high affinity sulfate transporter 1